MSLLNSKVYIGLSTKMFDDLFKAYYVKQGFSEFKVDKEIQLVESTDALPVTGHLEGRMKRPEFSIRERANGSYYTALGIKGNVDLKISSPTAESPILHTFKIAADVIVNIVLKPQGNNKADKIGLEFGGLENVVSPLGREQVQDMVDQSGISAIIDGFELDALSPLIDGIEKVLFFGQSSSNFPPRHEYMTKVKLMKGGGSFTDAIGIFVGLPSDQFTSGNLPSFVPTYSEVSMTMSEGLITAMTENAKNELQDYIKGLASSIKIRSLTTSVNNNSISLDARITETNTDTKIDIDTDVYLSLVPGSTRIGLRANIDVDYDFPWYIDLLKVFMIGEDEFLEEKLPNMAQNYIEDMANGMLGNLSKAIKLDGLSVEGIPVEVYPQELSLNDGKIDLHVQVLTYKTRDGMERASYSKSRSKFVFFTLKSGARYKVKDLAKFMNKNLIVVPGYHEVDKAYVRANPDDVEANNLLEQYGR